jgi:hypothetical protein
MSTLAPRPLSALLMQFPIRTLASDAEILRENELLIKCRNMAGDDHIIAIANTQYTGTLFLFAGHTAGVYHDQIHLSIDCGTIGRHTPLSELVPLLEKSGNVINVLVKDPPSIVMNWSHPSVLIPRGAYETGIDLDEGW